MPMFTRAKGVTNLVHDISGEVGVAESDDAIFDESPALVEILSGADLLLQAGGQERQQQRPHLHPTTGWGHRGWVMSVADGP